MILRTLAAAAVGSAVLAAGSAHAAAPDPQVIDPRGDANGINTGADMKPEYIYPVHPEAFDTVNRTSVPAEPASVPALDILSVRFETVKSPRRSNRPSGHSQTGRIAGR